MILNRLGNKKKLAHKIIQHFPEHVTFIDLFFGAGGLFFQKKLAKYNIVNDIDSEVFNLFNVLKTDWKELYKQIELAPYHKDLFNYWKTHKEKNPVMRAIRFLFLSNFGIMGAKYSLLFSDKNNTKKILLSNIEKTLIYLKDVQFTNKDFRDFFQSIQITNKKQCFVYADPPYINTRGNYNKFKKQDFIDLIEILIKTEIKFAVSHIDNQIINKIKNEYKLNKIFITEKRNLKSKERVTEILLTNYKPEGDLFYSI